MFWRQLPLFMPSLPLWGNTFWTESATAMPLTGVALRLRHFGSDAIYSKLPLAGAILVVPNSHCNERFVDRPRSAWAPSVRRRAFTFWGHSYYRLWNLRLFNAFGPWRT